MGASEEGRGVAERARLRLLVEVRLRVDLSWEGGSEVSAWRISSWSRSAGVIGSSLTVRDVTDGSAFVA